MSSVGTHRSHGRPWRQVRTVCYTGIARLLAVLRHPDDARSNVIIDGDRPGDDELEACHCRSHQPLAQLVDRRAQILFCLVHDSLSFARADFGCLGQHHDQREMAGTLPSA